MSSQPLTVGVEEEYLLLDPSSGVPVPLAERVRRIAAGEGRPDVEIEPELLQVQVEVATPICTTLADVEANVRRLRLDVAAAAVEAGCLLAGVGAASRFADELPPASEKPRYQEMHARAPRLVDEMLLNGMHVHIGIDDPADRIQVLNGLRPWLPAFVALAANSPFWDGTESGFGSWRSVHFTRWPVSGPPPVFSDPADYERRVARLIETGALVDRGQLYWQARLSQTYPTVEIRVADVQLTSDEAVLVAGLLRGLVSQLLETDARGTPVPDELLRASVWQAARDDLTGRLFDPLTGEHRPALDVVASLLEYVRPSLRRNGDEERIDALLAGRSPGATRQRSVHAGSGLSGVLKYVSDEFLQGC